MMAASDEARLIMLAQRGSLAAFNQLVQAHQATVYNLAWWILIEPNAAVQVTERVFVNAFRTVASCWEGNLGAWLAKRTLTECWRVPDARRGNARGAAALDQLAGGREAACVISALCSLPRRDRGLLVLADVLGFSYAEISSIIGLAPPQARARLAGARRRLAGYLATETRGQRQV